MIETLTRVWQCYVLGRHVPGMLTTYVRPLTPGEVPEGREYRFEGTNPVPMALDLPVCKRCRTVYWL